jgi:hypothetical protein
MRVLRRRFDNGIQFCSYVGVALALAFLSGSPLALALAAGFVVLAVRTLRAGVYFGPDGITVRNVFRTHRIAWDDYERADVTRAGTPSLPAIVLTTKTGRRVALWCVQPSTRGKRGVDKLVAVLRDVHDAVAAVRA